MAATKNEVIKMLTMAYSMEIETPCVVPRVP
jgi:hypothetical protein